MTGTGMTLSERFRGLKPWKLSSVEEEFEQRSTSVLSLSDVLKLSPLEITVNGKSKSGHSKVASTKKYAPTSLHKLFSQKSTEKEARTEKVKSTNGDVTIDQKRSVEKLKSQKSGKLSVQIGVKENPSKGKAPTDESEHTHIKLSNGSGNVPQNGVTPGTERPRDPRLLYGKGPYSILTKKPATVSQPVESENPDKSENAVKSANPARTENPVKKKKSFGESLTSAIGEGLQAVGKKSAGEKTIQVVKRNAVTKKITGVVQMNVKRKPLQNTDQNKPLVTEYQSSHNALKRIAEAKKVEDTTSADVSSGAVITPKALKGILKKDSPTVDSVETNRKGTESAVTSSTQTPVSKGKEPKDNKSKQAMIKQIANGKKPMKAKVKGSAKVVKPKMGVKNTTVSMPPNTPNIVLKLSITPSIDNGKLNLTVVSSSEEDQEKPDSNRQNDLTNIPLSIENAPQEAALPTDEPRGMDRPKKVPVTDEELKKGSPIQVRISKGANSHTPHSSASMSTHNKVSTSSEDNAHLCVGPDETGADQTPLVSSGCVYTTARKTAQVSTHQSVVKVNNRPPIPISYVYGTVVSSNKTEQVPSQPVQTPYQSGCGIDGTQDHQYISSSDNYMIPQDGYQGSKFRPHHQPGIDTQPHTETVASSISMSVTQDNECMTDSTTMEMQGGSSLPGHTYLKEDLSKQHTTVNMPISVRIQQNIQNTKKAIHNEGGCKPLHRTLTAIARASETEKATCEGADNLDVVDMDISAPACHMSNGIEGMSADSDMIPSSSVGNGIVVPPSLTSDGPKSITSDIKDSQVDGKKDSEATGSSGGITEEGKSRAEYQKSQVASWTTYLHEDTNSPMKSAFGSKQSFTETLSSMQRSSKSPDIENVRDEATTPHQGIAVPKDLSPSSHMQPTTQMNTTSSKSLLQSVPNESAIPPSASPVSEKIPKVPGNTFQLDDPLPHGSDIPTSLPDTCKASDNSSVQNPVRVEVTDTSKDNNERGKICSGTNQLEVVTITDERNSVSVHSAKASAESGKSDTPESDEKISEVLENDGMDGSRMPSNIIVRNRDILEDTLRQSKSPGTPVEDEFMDQDPFNLKESMHYEVHRNENLSLPDNGVCSSMAYEEENNNTCPEKEISSHHQYMYMKNLRHRDHLEFRRQYNRGSNRYPDSPRNRRAGPVYMRELSNVSDISMGDDEFETFEDGQSQEALEPLLVRGSARDNRGINHLDYLRDDPRISRREAYEDERHYSDRNMSVHSFKEIDSRYTKPAPRIEGYNEERAYSHPYPEERDHRYEAPDRHIHGYRDEQSPNSRIYDKNDGVPSRRDGAEHFQRPPANPMIMEQMTAVQALQLQINAAINPAHRAALVMALQALTGGPGQSSSGEVWHEVKKSSDRQSDFRNMPDEVSPKRLEDDCVQEGPSHRKVEFTVVLRDDAEQLLRKDSSKRPRAGDHTKVQRHVYDSEERFPDSSAQNQHESEYYRSVEFSGDQRDEYPRQDGVRRDRAPSQEKSRTVQVQRGSSEPLENPADSCSERQLSNRSRSPDGRPKKQKKSISKKSKKKAKDFHGRPLIKDKTNRTDPLSIPLENKDSVQERNDPRRSLTPDPVCAPKVLRPLNWPPPPLGEHKTTSRCKTKKHKQKDKKPRIKSVAILPRSVNLDSKEEETVGGMLNRASYADTLIKENASELTKDELVHPEALSSRDERTLSNGKEKVQIEEVLPEMTDKSDPVVEQTIEAFVTEARLASKQVDVESKDKNGNTAGGDVQVSSSTLKIGPPQEQVEQKNCKSINSVSSEHIRNGLERDDERRLDSSRDSATPKSSSPGGKKKSKSPESKKYKYSDDKQAKSDYEQAPQKRKLRERSPERHRIYRHSWNNREKTRHKRKYSSDSESDIDSDREHADEPGNKFKRYSHVSRFTKEHDWRSARNGPFRPRSGIRRHTPFSRFDYKKYIYPGNIGKPYGSQRTNNTHRGRGGFHGHGPLNTPWRSKEYPIDLTREMKNSPSMSMAALGYKSVVSWEDIHVALSEIKAKMLAVENSSREVRKASSQLQVTPLLKVYKSARTALECIMKEVSGRIPFDRREMYLHRRKYEILMADIRIHAEVLGKLIPPEREEEMLSEFVPNTTGIPLIDPKIELKVMNWLRLVKQSRMLLACKDLIYKKIRSLEQRVEAMRDRDKEKSRRVDDHMNRHVPRYRQWSGSDRSPDTTGPDSGNRRDVDQTKSITPPEVVSCPEFCPSTPETPVQPVREPLSEIRLPTHHHTMYPEGYPQCGSSTAFRDPPDPVRKLISSSDENLGLMDIPMPSDDDENVSFNLVDILPTEDQRPAKHDQCTKTVSSTEHASDFIEADSSSVDVKGIHASQILSPERNLVSQVPCDSATPPYSSSGFVKSFKRSTSSTYPIIPKFYISRVQRLASQTLMSPESGTDLQTLLKSEAEKNLKRSKSQRSPSCSEEPSSQVDMSYGKSELKSPRYSKKRHFLSKFQSDGHDGSPKGNVSKQCKSLEPVPTKIQENNLDEMYNEYDESCLVEESSKVDSPVPVSSSPTSNSESVPNKGGT